ncbi:hypothetical protein KKA14_08340 [bacterium]|nr:hypothetical protein [bacterium]
MNSNYKWLFIDHENIGNIESLDTKIFEKIYVFVGASHKALKINFVQLHQNVSMEVIKIRNVGQNNLDFHLSYFLGKLDATTDSNVEFVILSKDKGFDHLIRFINDNGRKCSRESLSTLKNSQKIQTTDVPSESQGSEVDRQINQQGRTNKIAKDTPVDSSPLAEDIQQKVSDTIGRLKKMAGNKRPRKVKTLKNFIKTFHKKLENEIYNHLLSLKCIQENNSSISYLIDSDAALVPEVLKPDKPIAEIIEKLIHLSGNQRPRKQKTLLNYIKNLKKGNAEGILKVLVDQNIVSVSEDGKTQYNL